MHEPKTVEEKNDITLIYLWQLPIHTDKRPDIVKNNLDKKITLIDVAIPSDKTWNTFTKVSEKL